MYKTIKKVTVDEIKSENVVELGLKEKMRL